MLKYPQRLHIWTVKYPQKLNILILKYATNVKETPAFSLYRIPIITMFDNCDTLSANN